MTTATGPDLSGAVTAVEELMDDTCTITRDAFGSDGEELDEDTLELATPDTPTLIYSGPCFVTASNIGSTPVDRVGLHHTLTRFAGNIPIASPEIEVGDVFTVTGSRRDAELVGRVFRVTEVVASTFAVMRKVRLEEWTR